MFRHADAGKVWWPVTLAGRGADGADAEIRLLFTTFTRTEMREQETAVLRSGPAAMMAKAEAGEVRTLEDVLALMERDAQVDTAMADTLQQRVTGWKGVGDPVAGTEEPFAADKLLALLAHPWFLRAARDALFAASRGAVRKN